MSATDDAAAPPAKRPCCESCGGLKKDTPAAVPPMVATEQVEVAATPAPDPIAAVRGGSVQSSYV